MYAKASRGSRSMAFRGFSVAGALESATGNEYNGRKPAEGFPALCRRPPQELQSRLIVRWGCSESVPLRSAEQALFFCCGRNSASYGG